MNRYIYIDPIFDSGSEYDDLKIESNNSILTVFRLITGTIDCKDDFKSTKYRFRENYTNFPFSSNTRLGKKTIIHNFPSEVKIEDINEYFKKSRFNSNFYKSIEIEILKCLIAEKQKRHLEAFFYLYRIIEGISYTLPLMYVSKNKSYDKTYKQLQAFFANNKDKGELTFFKTFISETFKNEYFFQLTIDINFNCIQIYELKERYFKLYIEKLKNEKIRLSEQTEFEEIKLNFVEFYKMLISIRNRFFHFSKGSWQENISSIEVIHPDLFFEPIINHGLNWVSIILFEIIKNDFSKSEN